MLLRPLYLIIVWPALFTATIQLCLGQSNTDPSNTKVAQTSLRRSLSNFAASWNKSGWNQPSGRRQYLRSLDDTSWQARMRILRSAAEGNTTAVDSLVDALQSNDVGTRIVAAQAIGYSSGDIPIDKLIQIIKTDESPSVQLYLIDSLAMNGVSDIEKRLGQWKPRNRDVQKHLAYTASRKGEKIESEIVETIANWDPKKTDSAKIGKLAPDFELQSLSGETVKLSDFRGKQAVVLVFIYGDT